MRRLRAALAIACIVNDEDPSLMGGGPWVSLERFEPPPIDRCGIPGRFRDKTLQPLYRSV